MSVPLVGGGKIVSIETLRQKALKRGQGASDAAKPTDREPEAPPATLELSPLAQAELERDQSIARVRSDLAELPDVRSEKVIEARLRLSTGYYDKPEIRARIALSFLRESGGESTPSEGLTD